MKTSQPAALAVATLAMCVLLSNPCLAKRKVVLDPNLPTFPAMPSGWLTAFPSVVQTGTKPTLTWAINYPSIVEDYVTIVEPATVVSDVAVDCEIRVLGAGVTVKASNSNNYSFVPTEALISINDSSYTRIFYGTNNVVNPNQVVSSFTLQPNQKLEFGGRYYYNNSWGPYFKSDSGTDNVRTLVNGDVPPSNVPDYNAPSLESFIKPYLTPTGKVQIGPMDVIVFMELTHYSTQKSDPGYDLQDMVLLVTFKSKAKTNNGHGNNLDGIDYAPFINLDTDPNVDDEGSGGGAYPSNP